MTRFPPAVMTLLVVNVLVFVAGALTPHWQGALVDLGALWYPTNVHFHGWQLVSYMFLHGGGSHLFFNMFALFSFGAPMEARWGTSRFFIFWFVCGIGAGLIHTGVSVYQYHHYADQLVAAGLAPDEIGALLASGRGDVPVDGDVRSLLLKLYRIYAGPTIGASGAIYGVLVAFGCLFPNAKLALLFFPIPIAAKIVIPCLLVLDLLSGVTGFSLFGGGVAHFAHIGGAIVGFIMMMFMRERSRPATG